MRKILFCIVLLFNCTGAYALIVDLTDYFPVTLTPSCYRYEEWGGEIVDGYQSDGYSPMIDISNLQNGVEYDFALNFFPVGDNIDNIDNYHYRISVGINWGESGIGSGSSYTFYVGPDWQIGEWNQWTITKTFADLEYLRVQTGVRFYRTDTPPPWEGEWQTTLYIDSPIPEPSMVLMVLLALPFISRRVIYVEM
jgi:hypothetical protein